MRRYWLSLLVAALALPAQEPPAAAQDPALARIRARLQEADAARAEGKHEDARAIVREALAECLALSGLEGREDAHEVLWEVGKAAERAAELRTAHDAYERVCEYRSRTLPDDHPDLQAARANLAIMKNALGDLAGARVLEKKVWEVLSRTLPDDHPDLQHSRHSLGLTKRELGDLAGARALEEKVFEVFSRTLPDDHPDLQRAWANLAIARCELGDLAGARALQEKVYEVFSRTLPDDHPDLQRARANLAATKHALGDLAGARALIERVYEVRSGTLPDDHPDLQKTRSGLAWTHVHLGNVAGAVTFARARSSAARRRLSSWALAPRELGAMAAQEDASTDLLLTLACGFGEIEARPDVTGDALALSQTLRGVQTRAARASRRARTADPERAVMLESELRTAAAEVSRVASEALDGEGEELEAKRRDRSERLVRAVDEKERLERELATLAAKAGHIATAAAAEELAAALPERSAAAAIIAFTHFAPDPQHPGCTIDEARLAAIVLDRAAHAQLVALGPAADVQTAVETLRNAQQAQSARGLRPSATTASESRDVFAAAEKLAARVIAPVLAACGSIDTLYLAVDDLLELVPLDALPLDRDHLVGDRVALRQLVSLLELLEPPGPAPGEAAALLLGGGIDYGRTAEDAAPFVDANAASPVVERAGEAGAWTPLPGTAREASEIAELFAHAFPEGKTERFADERVGKAQIAQAAPGATFVHLATHGYFAPESVKSVADAAPGEGAITGLSPLALCGLALSGANLPPDDLGRHAGILTAEEILSLDLSRCYLVTLSACDTSLGVRRAGQGYASLRAALQGAGARFVLTSLWKVGDEATMELMVDFYRRLWVQKKDPHAALWEAKTAARAKGAAFRDWAGWVLTGR